jgi:hypothetical protein
VELKPRLRFHEDLEHKSTPIWFWVVWVLVTVGSLYFPFVRSPEMTGSQLLLNYWWFYVPALTCIGIVTFLEHRPRRGR